MLTFILAMLALTMWVDFFAGLTSTGEHKVSKRSWVRRLMFSVLLALGGAAAALYDFECRKAAASLLMPAGLLFMVLWCVFVFDLRRGAWLRALFQWVLLSAYIASGSSWVGQTLVGELEAKVPRDPGGRFDVVAVLGGGSHLNPQGQPELGPAGDRLRLGAALIHEGRTQHLVVTGQSILQNRDLAREAATLLKDMGVSTSSVTQMSEPVNTSTEIEALLEVCKIQGWTRIGLITSAWHVPRALRILQRMQPDARKDGACQMVPIAANHLSKKSRGLSILQWIPTSSGFHLTHRWAWETLGRYLP